MQTFLIHTDGGARGNPGPAGIGAVIEELVTDGGSEGSIVRAEISEYIGETTNNVAEYKAVVRALETLIETTAAGAVGFELRLDSQLVERQLNGVYKVKDAGMRGLYEQVQKLMPHFSETTFTHVRREENKQADALVNEALDKFLEKE